MPAFTAAELEAYLDESLPVEEMMRMEEALRREPALLSRLKAINSRRDSGGHTLGEIWRRHRLSCPPREQLGSYLLDALSPAAGDYIEFHLQTVGCRLCQANLADLRQQQSEAAATVQTRRKKYFQSSAGLLRR
ncbi:MAG: hypothetical protein AB7O62_09445 [Pirellulales bacterium]